MLRTDGLLRADNISKMKALPPLNIGLVTTFPPLSVGCGGIPRSVGLYIKAISAAGAKVTLLSPDTTDYNPGSTHKPVTREALETNFPLRRANLYRAAISKKWGVGLGGWRILKDLRWLDAVGIHGTRTMPTVLAGLYCRFSRKPYWIVSHANLDMERAERTRQKRPFLFALTEKVVRASLKKAMAIVVTGNLERRTLPDWTGDIPVVEIENFFEFDRPYSPPKSRSEGTVFVFVGRIESDKGILAFTRTWQAVAGDQESLLLVGSGSGTYFDALNSIARSDSRVKMLGLMSNAQVKNTIEQSHFLVLPTGMDDPVTENFGNVVAEALISSRPALVAQGLHWDEVDSPAIRAFEANTSGATTALANALALPDSEYVELCRSARELADRFHLNAAIPRVRNLLLLAAQDRSNAL